MTSEQLLVGRSNPEDQLRDPLAVNRRADLLAQMRQHLVEALVDRVEVKRDVLADKRADDDEHPAAVWRWDDLLEVEALQHLIVKIAREGLAQNARDLLAKLKGLVGIAARGVFA